MTKSAPHQTHMEAEILSQPEVWRECSQTLGRSPVVKEICGRIERDAEWLFIGCGSSYYIGQAAAAFFSLLGLRARAVPPSELLLFPELTLAQSGREFVPVLISRSGKTSEVLQAAELLEKDRGVRTIAITCSAREQLEKISSFTLHTLAADEQSTVMTRSFTSMLLALQYLGTMIAGNTVFRNALLELPNALSLSLPKVHAAVGEFVSTHDFLDYVFLAQGPLAGLANECMLKVTESSSSYVQSFHTLEFRHGPKSIVSRDVLTVFLLSESGFEREAQMLEEVKSLGGTTMVVTERADAQISEATDLLIELRTGLPEPTRLAAFAPPGQLLGLFTGLKKGLNPDAPPHLSRAVILDSAV